MNFICQQSVWCKINSIITIYILFYLNIKMIWSHLSWKFKWAFLIVCHWPSFCLYTFHIIILFSRTTRPFSTILLIRGKTLSNQSIKQSNIQTWHKKEEMLISFNQLYDIMIAFCKCVYWLEIFFSGELCGSKPLVHNAVKKFKTVFLEN